MTDTTPENSDLKSTRKKSSPSQSAEARPSETRQHATRSVTHAGECGRWRRSDLEGAKDGLGVSERLPVGRDIAFFHANRHDGRKTGERVVHKRHSARFSRRWRNRNQSRRTRRYLAAAFRRSAGLDPRLSASLLHCRHHRASRRAAHRRLRLDLARRRRIQRQRPDSQDYEEHRRDDFGEESHASVLRMPILSVPVCDLYHKLETFLQDFDWNRSSYQSKRIRDKGYAGHT